MADDYEFTRDWFAHAQAEQVWRAVIPLMARRKSALEIGAFEGRASVWIVENILEDGGFLTCIDTWGGGEEHTDINFEEVEARFARNSRRAEEKNPTKQIFTRKAESVTLMARWVGDMQGDFDFIYIDGSHRAPDVLADAVLAWRLLAVGGVMVFDDYVWGDPRDILHRPKLAIDAFINTFAEHLQVLHIGAQAIIIKTS